MTDSIDFVTLYRSLVEANGPRNWWPARSKFEVMVGAILTQNTSWKNVEKAIELLRAEKLLNPHDILSTGQSKLASLIRSSGYFNQKAIKLRRLSEWYIDNGGTPAKIRQRFPLDRLEALRSSLLGVHGVGPETADSILCYALGYPVFVVDAYTFRIVYRIAPRSQELWTKYEELRAAVEADFEKQFSAPEELTRHYNEFHAQLVGHGNRLCRKRSPVCDQCPISASCHSAFQV